MSIGTPNGILDITGATLRVSKMEFRQSTGFDTVLNNVARNTMLLMDETEQTTSNSWALKLPNAWVAEFHGYWASGSSGAPILFNFYNDSTSGTNGYTLSMNDTTISINYDGGSTLGSATLSTTLNNDAYRKVAIIFERSVLDVSVDGEHVFHFADSQLRDRVYDNNSGYVTFTHSSTDERKLKNLKFTNGDKWVREIDSSNIAYVGGNVGIGTTIPGTKLDVSGTVRGTHLIGDGSAISAIQSSNVSDFGSNVTRIGTLETDLGDNSSRITNLSSNLSDNSSRITALESGDISISGDKTFTGDIIFESNIHMNGGNVLVANTINMTVSDPIIELGLNNIGTNDLGIIMTRPAANSNVAFVYDESDDILRMGYTLNGASDSVVDLDSNALAVSVQGDLEVGTANLFVDTSTSRVGIGTDSPAYTLDVHGSSNVGALTTTSVSGDGSGITNILSSSVNDFSSNVTRISNLETDLGSNVTRIGTLESGDMTIGGEKTFSSNLRVGTANLFVDTVTGNVGVGTTSPVEKLDVRGNAYLENNSIFMSGYNEGPTNNIEYSQYVGKRYSGRILAGMEIENVRTNSAGTAITNDGHYSQKLHFRAHDFGLYGGLVGDRTMSIVGGNVGIGTTEPYSKLDTRGDTIVNSGEANWDTGMKSLLGTQDLIDAGIIYTGSISASTDVDLPPEVVNDVIAKFVNSHTGEVYTGQPSTGYTLSTGDVVVFDVWIYNSSGSTINSQFFIFGGATQSVAFNIPSNSTWTKYTQTITASAAGGFSLRMDNNSSGKTFYFTGLSVRVNPSNTTNAPFTPKGFPLLGTGTVLSVPNIVAKEASIPTLLGNVGIGVTSPGIVLDVGSSLSNPQIGRNYATGSVHDADKRDAIYFGRWDGTGRDFLGIKCRVDTHTALGYGDYSNQTKLEFHTWGNNYASSREVMCIRGDGNVGIGTASPGFKLEVNGTMRHNGLSMSSGTTVDQLTTITKSLTITAAWMDTGIKATNLATGTYIVQIYNVSDHGSGGLNYEETYSGIMSWYAGNTNSTEATEIPLTAAGHAPNDNHIYLRVMRTLSADTNNLKLQIRKDTSMSSAYTYTFKFRRMI